MKNTVLVGNGYWGGKILDKLLKVSNVLSVQSSRNYNPLLFENADWIFVATPMSAHYSIVRDCLFMRKNVFVEKPFTSSIAEATELVELARKNRTLLYVDNVFLHRSELVNCLFRPQKKVQFIWYKYGPFNDSLINDLLYHDLYILVSKVGSFSVESFTLYVCDRDVFRAHFKYSTFEVEIDYNRLKTDLRKTICIDGEPLTFSHVDQDPLMDIILDCLTENHDFKSNQDLNLRTMEIMDFITRAIN